MGQMILAWDCCLSAISRGEEKRKDRYAEERKSHVDLDTPRRVGSIRRNVGMSLFAYSMRMRQGFSATGQQGVSSEVCGSILRLNHRNGCLPGWIEEGQRHDLCGNGVAHGFHGHLDAQRCPGRCTPAAYAAQGDHLF